MNILADTEHWL